jgi:8-hydroxy-5-deazaflavin:NADPH oxidoreductase
MKITVIGTGNIGGGLARRWERAGHTVTEIGRDGGDASGADVVLVAVPSGEIADALRKVSGLEGKVAIDGDERLFRPQRGVPVARARGEGDRRRAGRQGVQHELRGALRSDRRAAGAPEQPLCRRGGRPRGDRAADPGRGLRAGLRRRARPSSGSGGFRWGLGGAIGQSGLGPFFYRYAKAGEL